MVQIYGIIDKLNSFLHFEKKNHRVGEYRIVLSIYNQIVTYLRGIDSEEWFKKIDTNYPNVSFVVADEDDYDSYFESSKVVNIDDSRIRLKNLFDDSKRNINNDIPVVTFYSYKGGVGRSTTMASFASYLAIHKGMKVVLMDCDFEAPGLTNFFMEDPLNVSQKNGLVEYFLDFDVDREKTVLKNYYWEASKKYSGKGFIYVFPAGNLSVEDERGYMYHNDMVHYLNGMSKLDMFSKESMCDRFKQLFSLIKDRLKPDIILMDSRTGFSDIYGITAFRLSDIVVGFFGSDVQSRPGIEFFLNILTRKNAPRLLMAHSIIPSGQKIKLHKWFCEYVKGRLADISERIAHGNEGHISSLDIEPYAISDNEMLRYIGKPYDSYEEYIDLITNQEFSDYKKLFEKLYDLYNDVKGADVVSDEEQNKHKRDLQHVILENTLSNLPPLYGEEVKDFQLELQNGRYFFRRCMQDLFNAEKFLVCGEKGTGKSYIYQSLANSDIVDDLKSLANKREESFIFVPIVTLSNLYSTSKLNYSNEINPDLFFERFWIVYIWNEVMRRRPFGFKTHLQTFEISNQNSTETSREFRTRIQNEDLISSIEKDLVELDHFIDNSVANGHVVFIFDELDKLVKPTDWSERIAPLINLCRNMAYGHLEPKLFVRKDLFERMGNINNKNDLKNRTIEIEWSREELFSYFFKLVLSHSKKEFFELMSIYNYYPKETIIQVQSQIQSSGDQPPLNEIVLKNLVAVFFGKYADIDNSTRFGLSYDWFFNNLKNANDTISLRPFIDLLQESIRKAVESARLSNQPVLSPFFYTAGSVRSNAVKRHIQDLSSEDGNKDLNVVIEFIKNKAPINLKKDFLPFEKFNSLLDLIINDGQLSENIDKESLTNMLIVDGIVRQKFRKTNSGVSNGFQFALLYKYYLGLKTRNFNSGK